MLLGLPGNDGSAGSNVVEATATAGGFTVSQAFSGTSGLTADAWAYQSLGAGSSSSGSTITIGSGSGSSSTSFSMSGGTLIATSQLSVGSMSSLLMTSGFISTSHTYNDGIILISGGSADFGAIQPNSALTGTVSVSGGSVRVASIRQATLSVSGTGSLSVATNGSNTGVSRVTTLNVDSTTGATLDLGDNDLVVDYSSTSPLGTLSTPGSILGELSKAYHATGGKWAGPGITSSLAAANSGTYSLAYGEASKVLGLSGGTFSGQAVDSTAVLIKFTYAGDFNLDGKVDIADLGIIASNYGHAGTFTWTDGDANYDGTVNIADQGIMSTNYGAGSSTPLAMPYSQALALVESETGQELPEPGVAATAIGALFLFKRRR